MTESMLGTCLYKHQHTLTGQPHETKRLASAGQPYFGCQIVLRKDDGSPCSTNEVGEITILSDATMQGYWNNSVATHQTIRDGWCYTGDLGYFDTQHFLFLVDRKKDMINRGGYKIYTIEVENALYAHSAVQECAVVSKPCPVLGERVHAFVMLKTPGDLEIELREFCRTRLSDYKVPESFTISTTPLPRNANGKLVKRDMRDQLLKSLVA
jgi:acyl-CoA synthetase (AMP-forming)/AMP-acid ligase II